MKSNSAISLEDAAIAVPEVTEPVFHDDFTLQNKDRASTPPLSEDANAAKMARRRPARTGLRETTINASPPSRAPLSWWVSFSALAILLLAPLMLTEIPPLLDYPNHLARMYILANVARDPELARIYGANWQIVPNVGIDLAMPALMRLLPLAAAGKVFLGLALLMPVAGVIVLHRVMFRTVSYWPLAVGLVAYNRLFFAGFVNFLIGVGLALLGAALWQALLERRAVLRVGTASVVSIAIFFCHLIAAGFYGLLLFGFELARAWRLRRISIARLLLLAVPFIIPAIFYLRAPIGEADPDAGHGLVDTIRHYYWALSKEPPGLKLYGLMGPFLSYWRLLDIAAIAIVAVTLGACAIRGRLRIAPAIGGVFAMLLLAYPVIPFQLMRTAWVDQRLPILAGFLLFAGTLPALPAQRTRRLVLAAIALALAVRVVGIALVWEGRDAVLADFRQVIAPVRAGDRVLVVQPERNDDTGAMVNRPDSVRAMLQNDAIMHLPALLVFEQKAFWPLLFSAPGKQPVKVLPPYTDLSLPEGELPWIGGLTGPDPATVTWAPYLSGWEKKFDWVLVMQPGQAQNGYDLLPDRLEPAGAGRIAALYRIKK
jgi:hypothetical protein